MDGDKRTWWTWWSSGKTPRRSGEVTGADSYVETRKSSYFTDVEPAMQSSDGKQTCSNRYVFLHVGVEETVADDDELKHTWVMVMSAKGAHNVSRVAEVSSSTVTISNSSPPSILLNART